MDNDKAPNETELTSTMGKMLSVPNKEEKSDSNDSTPTSSTDANTNIVGVSIVSDDPISSTSSDSDPKKQKEKSIVESTDEADRAVSDVEPDFLEISMMSGSTTERITENVDDLVQDLETLLGESTDSFTISVKTREPLAEPVRKDILTEKQDPVVPEIPIDNEVSSNTNNLEADQSVSNEYLIISKETDTKIEEVLTESTSTELPTLTDKLDSKEEIGQGEPSECHSKNKIDSEHVVTEESPIAAEEEEVPSESVIVTESTDLNEERAVIVAETAAEIKDIECEDNTQLQPKTETDIGQSVKQIDNADKDLIEPKRDEETISSGDVANSILQEECSNKPEENYSTSTVQETQDEITGDNVSSQTDLTVTETLGLDQETDKTDTLSQNQLESQQVTEDCQEEVKKLSSETVESEGIADKSEGEEVLSTNETEPKIVVEESESSEKEYIPVVEDSSSEVKEEIVECDSVEIESTIPEEHLKEETVTQVTEELSTEEDVEEVSGCESVFTTPQLTDEILTDNIKEVSEQVSTSDGMQLEIVTEVGDHKRGAIDKNGECEENMKQVTVEIKEKQPDQCDITEVEVNEVRESDVLKTEEQESETPVVENEQPMGIQPDDTRKELENTAKPEIEGSEEVETPDEEIQADVSKSTEDARVTSVLDPQDSTIEASDVTPSIIESEVETLLENAASERLDIEKEEAQTIIIAAEPDEINSSSSLQSKDSVVSEQEEDIKSEEGEVCEISRNESDNTVCDSVSNTEHMSKSTNDSIANKLNEKPSIEQLETIPQLPDEISSQNEVDIEFAENEADVENVSSQNEAQIEKNENANEKSTEISSTEEGETTSQNINIEEESSDIQTGDVELENTDKLETKLDNSSIKEVKIELHTTEDIEGECETTGNNEIQTELEIKEKELEPIKEIVQEKETSVSAKPEEEEVETVVSSQADDCADAENVECLEETPLNDVVEEHNKPPKADVEASKIVEECASSAEQSSEIMSEDQEADVEAPKIVEECASSAEQSSEIMSEDQEADVEAPKIVEDCESSAEQSSEIISEDQEAVANIIEETNKDSLQEELLEETQAVAHILGETDQSYSDLEQNLIEIQHTVIESKDEGMLQQSDVLISGMDTENSSAASESNIQDSGSLISEVPTTFDGSMPDMEDILADTCEEPSPSAQIESEENLETMLAVASLQTDSIPAVQESQLTEKEIREMEALRMAVASITDSCDSAYNDDENDIVSNFADVPEEEIVKPVVIEEPAKTEIELPQIFEENNDACVVKSESKVTVTEIQNAHSSTEETIESSCHPNQSNIEEREKCDLKDLEKPENKTSDMQDLEHQTANKLVPEEQVNEICDSNQPNLGDPEDKTCGLNQQVVVEEEEIKNESPSNSTDVKVEEPLSISIGDQEKIREKEKPYSPKVKIKPIKVPDEEVSTTSETEVSKGSLKMTITKQSDKMHSILKVYNPEEDSEPSVEEPIPKLIIKQKIQQIEQQHSPKMSTRSSRQVCSPTRSSSPRITVKPVVKPEVTPLKISLKPVVKQDDTSKKHCPKVTKTIKASEDVERVSSPKVTIKPIVKPLEFANEQGHSPKVTIKPITKPCESDSKNENVSSTPKVTIKPIKRPLEDDSSEDRPNPKITIKPVLKPSDIEADQALCKSDGDRASPKISIKPVVKPPELEVENESEEETKGRIVLKINKVNLPTPSKESKKREHPVEEEKLAKIKLKFSREGGHPHIVHQDEEPSKRLRKDSAHGVDENKKRGHEEHAVSERSKKLKTGSDSPSYENTRSRHKELADPENNEDDEVRLIEPKLDSPIVISEDSRSQHSADCVIIEDAPDSLDNSTNDKTQDLSKSASKEVVTPSSTANVTPPSSTPRKRGRPRKVPLEVREEYKEPTPEPVIEEPPPPKPEPEPPLNTSSRPKRSCRGQNVIATLGIKPRKPRGGAKGRGGKVNMGDRPVPMKAEKAPKLSKARLKLLQKSAEEQLKEQKQAEQLKKQNIEPKPSTSGVKQQIKTPIVIIESDEEEQVENTPKKTPEKNLRTPKNTPAKKVLPEKTIIETPKVVKTITEPSITPIVAKVTEEADSSSKPAETKIEKRRTYGRKAKYNKSRNETAAKAEEAQKQTEEKESVKEEVVSSTKEIENVIQTDDTVEKPVEERGQTPNVETYKEEKPRVEEKEPEQPKVEEAVTITKLEGTRTRSADKRKKSIEKEKEIKKPKQEECLKEVAVEKLEIITTRKNSSIENIELSLLDIKPEAEEKEPEKIDALSSRIEQELLDTKSGVEEKEPEKIEDFPSGIENEELILLDIKPEVEEPQPEKIEALPDPEKPAFLPEKTQTPAKFSPVKKTDLDETDVPTKFSPIKTPDIECPAAVLPDVPLLAPPVTETSSSKVVASPASSSKIPEVVMVDEETRMSADTSSRAQTPARQIVAPSTDIVEESQSSVQSSATTESSKASSRPTKSRVEVHHDPLGDIISADQLAEYYWNNNGPFMLQEQVAQFLGIKSFKRKYPGIMRRMVDMQERDFIRETLLASEAMCDLGLTAVNSADILDIMFTDFQDKYEEYCKFQREKQAKELLNRQKALSQVTSQEKCKMDITEQAVQSAAQWNANFNKTRKEQRKASMDLQTLTVHYPKGKIKQINKPKIGHYPVALVPGQFTDYYQEFTPTELNNLPLNTMCYNEINFMAPVDSDDSDNNSDSDSDSSSSSSGSSGSSSSIEDCKTCKPPLKKVVAK